MHVLSCLQKIRFENSIVVYVLCYHTDKPFQVVVTHVICPPFLVAPYYPTGPSPYSHNLPAHLSATSAQQSGGEVAAQDRNVHDIVGDIGEKRKRKRSSRLWNDSSDGDQESDGDDEEDSDQEPEVGVVLY